MTQLVYHLLYEWLWPITPLYLHNSKLFVIEYGILYRYACYKTIAKTNNVVAAVVTTRIRECNKFSIRYIYCMHI